MATCPPCKPHLVQDDGKRGLPGKLPTIARAHWQQCAKTDDRSRQNSAYMAYSSIMARAYARAIIDIKTMKGCVDFDYMGRTKRAMLKL